MSHKSKIKLWKIWKTNLLLYWNLSLNNRISRPMMNMQTFHHPTMGCFFVVQIRRPIGLFLITRLTAAQQRVAQCRPFQYRSKSTIPVKTVEHFDKLWKNMIIRSIQCLWLLITNMTNTPQFVAKILKGWTKVINLISFNVHYLYSNF